ncbi:Deoxycytidine monophosphate (dCMP) deaminase [Gonapodya sp. JEL0774]|nr:Deoxycytidine monophosphate (dCMP) deaminase [Gonapodya sp. JEL0774]
MLIAICGPICSGKTTITEFLVDRFRFERLVLRPSVSANDGGHSESAAVANDRYQANQPGDGGGQASYQVFRTASDVINYVMADDNWKRNFVLDSIRNVDELDAFRRRPFFLLVGVDAPVGLRYIRFSRRVQNSDEFSLEDFVKWDDREFVNIHRILHGADLRILNTTSSSDAFINHLQELNIANPDRLRPGWDTYFMLLSYLAARRSNCMKRRVGCIVVRNQRVIATGYNGTPRGVRNCNEGGCARCNSSNMESGAGLDTCLCLHAEENALLEAGRERTESRPSGDAGTTLYCNTCPCLGCAKKIVQVGVNEVVYAQEYKMDEMTRTLFREAGVALRRHEIPEESFWIDEDGSLGSAEVKGGKRYWALEARLGW